MKTYIDNDHNSKRLKCFNCGNYMKFVCLNDKCIYGVCKVCNSYIYLKQRTSKEKLIKIIAL